MRNGSRRRSLWTAGDTYSAMCPVTLLLQLGMVMKWLMIGPEQGGEKGQPVSLIPVLHPWPRTCLFSGLLHLKLPQGLPTFLLSISLSFYVGGKMFSIGERCSFGKHTVEFSSLWALPCDPWQRVHSDSRCALGRLFCIMCLPGGWHVCLTPPTPGYLISCFWKLESW